MRDKRQLLEEKKRSLVYNPIFGREMRKKERCSGSFHLAVGFPGSLAASLFLTAAILVLGYKIGSVRRSRDSFTADPIFIHQNSALIINCGSANLFISCFADPDSE